MSRGIRRAVLITVTVLLAGPVCVPPAAAKTTTSPDGTVVTIHVPIDITIMGADVVADSQRQRIAELVTMAQDFYWNPWLKDLEYGDCLTFKLDLQVEVHPDVGRTFRDPIPHQIDWYNDPNVDSFVLTPGDPDHTRDHRSPFDDFVTGQFGDLDVPTFVHELGHLLGLGDDYIRVADDSDQGWHAEDKPGREGTVMGKSIWGRWEGRELGSIDQDIVDRLGDLVDEVGDLPLCETWTGTFSMSLNLAGICEVSADGEVQLSVVAGAVTGTITQSGSITCPSPGADHDASLPFELTGTFKEDEFLVVLFDIDAASGGLISGQLCFVEPVVVGVDSPGSASAHWTWDHPAGGTASCQMTLERDEEEPALD